MEKIGNFLATPQGLEDLARQLREENAKLVRVDVMQESKELPITLRIDSPGFGDLKLDKPFFTPNALPKETTFSKILDKLGITLLLDKLNQALIRRSENGTCEYCFSQGWGIHPKGSCRCH